MPVFNLVCKACGQTDRRLCQPALVFNMMLKCRRCGAPLFRDPNPPTTQVKETLDNGLMTRRVERYAEAERLARDNAKVR